MICGICDNYCYYPREQVWTGAKNEGTHNNISRKGCMDSYVISSTYVIQVLPAGSRRSINSKSTNDADYPFNFQQIPRVFSKQKNIFVYFLRSCKTVLNTS